MNQLNAVFFFIRYNQLSCFSTRLIYYLIYFFYLRELILFRLTVKGLNGDLFFQSEGNEII